MKITSSFKKLLQLSILLTSCVVTTACVSDVYAKHEIRQVSVFGDDGNKIRIINGYDKSIAQYQVNGKTFTWQDLNTEQQSRFLAAEKPFKAAEDSVNHDEEKLEAAVEKVEAKAEEIENIAELIEHKVHDTDFDNMTLKQIKKHKKQQKQELKKHKLAIKAKQLELDELEKRLPKIDKALLEKLEQTAKVYESTLVAVAAEL